MARCTGRVAAFLLTLAALPAHAAVDGGYTLEIFNTDDSAVAYVNGRKVLTCGYRKSCAKGIDPYLRSGRNTVRIEFSNKSSGYSWGYALKQDGKQVAGGSCGKAGRQSCGPGTPEGVYKTVVKRLEIE
jgi:hypothetical protein